MNNYSKLRLAGRIRTTTLAICLAALSSTLFVGPANGQVLQGINGTVTDATGAVVPNATVTATNDATGVSKTAVTSSAGTYEFNDLIPGTYTVKAEAPGFQTSVHNGVGVETTRISTVNAVLQPGETTQTVNVTESAIAIDTTQPQLGTTIENKVVQELPLQLDSGDSRGRQIQSFIFLAPGVTGSTFSYRVNGGVDFESEVVFNGIPMAQSETQGFQTIWNPPFELVNQYNVLRSTFSAQYGLAQGVITYNTRSGTNSLHGDGFEIIRNNFFDARGAYNPTVPIDKENNYGFTVSGPVFIPKLYNGKNRTFFTLSMEWYRRTQLQTGNVSLPTAAEKAGDFSGLGTQIWNPIGSGCTANGNTPGTQFRGNVIPSVCFSPLSASLLQYFPNPSLPGFVNNQPTLLGVFPTRQSPWGYTIDHNISDKQSIHWTEWRNPWHSYATENGATALPITNPLTSVTYNPDLGTVFILNYAYTVSPHLVMTAGASWLGELNDQISQRPNNISFPAAPGSPQVPAITFSGPLSPITVGSPWIESINRKLGIVAENNWQWVKGKHTFNIGGEFRRTYQDDNECQQCAGSLGFSNDETANPANLSNTGNAFASFLLGTVDNAARIGSQEERLRNKDFSFYIQDDIKLTPRFTLNAGVRWDIMVPFTALNNPIVYFDSKIIDPLTGTLGAATKFGDCDGCADITRAAIHWGHVSPRLGGSYELNDKTVIQGGFSENYLDGGAYEYGTAKVAVNYGNLLVGSYSAPSLNSSTPGFGSWDTHVLPFPAPVPFNNGLGTGTFINAFNPAQDGWAPYVLLWNIGIQRELPGNMFLSAAYAGNRANRLPSQLNPINQLPAQFLSQYGANLGLPYATEGPILGIPLPFPNFLSIEPNASVLQALRPYPQFQGSDGGIFNNFDDTGSSFYNALQLSLEKRYTNGLSFLVSYNLSKMMSDTNSGFTSFAALAYNKNNQASEWTIDNNDQTHMINIAATYELPFGKGRRYMNRGGVANAVLGGWQISPILTYATGTPLWSGNPGGSVYVSGDPLGNQCAPCNRANVVSYSNMMLSYNNVYQGLPVINKADFSDPGPWGLGNAPRVIGVLRNPFQYNENIALAKYFPLGEKVKLKLEMEYFNVLNRVVFGGPDLNFEDSTFGQVINSQNNSPRQGEAFLGIDW
ncbi:MAG TPA: TonB-dependent receptor [Bryobacteraceae bacterium]|nr:TonB-dependent receptor [Bryobacteraceae bacterium]